MCGNDTFETQLNAKELILAKINAGTSFAKMYLYLMTSGYNLDDIAAFMFSPIAEFIDSQVAPNMFQPNGMSYSSADNAINLALGEINNKAFLHGVISETEEETGDIYTVDKAKYVQNLLEFEISDTAGLQDLIYTLLEINPEENEKVNLNLNTLMKGFILAAISERSKDINLKNLIGVVNDPEINTYLKYCQGIIMQLRKVNAQYDYQLDELLKDAEEFKNIYGLSAEMSTVASAYLGLNQGLPTDKLSLLKRLNSMRKVISVRERALNINEDFLFGEAKTDAQKARQNKAWRNVIENITSNNSLLSEEEIRTALTEAHEAGIMNHFDVTQLLTDDEYKQKAKDYLHVIKGSINVIDMMDRIPHYKAIMECLKALVVADKSLSVKSRLIGELTSNRPVTDKQLQGIIRYVDKLSIAEFLDQCDVVTTHKSVDGFNALFDNIKTNHFDLMTSEGVTGFKKFVETEFLSYLKQNYSSNPLVKHLKTIMVDGKINLSVDIDLLNPEVSTASKLAYDDILRGVADFEKIPYNNEYSITDILQLYNLIVNNNQYGGERLTTTFKVSSNPNSVLARYFKFVGEKDFDFTSLPEYTKTDYEISAAPLVTPYSMRFHSEPFIRVKDNVWDYVYYKYDPKTNEYREYSILPALSDPNISIEQQNQRRLNFIENSPFEMPERTKRIATLKLLDFEGELTPDLAAQIKHLFANMSMSGKILIVKDC